MEARGLLNRLGLGPDAGLHSFVFLGEAGSGKSEIALNLARLLAEAGDRPVHFFDLDMTKPLFRSRDQAEALSGLGVAFHFEEQFMDAPTAAGGVRRLLKDEGCYTVLDVGGDYIGARSVGGYAPLLNSPSTAVYYVINPFRPWSATLEHIDRVLGEVLGVSHVALDRLRLVGNPNLGPQTTAQDVVDGFRSVEEMVAPYKPFDFLCAWEPLASQAEAALSRPVLPLTLYLTYPWNDAL